MSEQAAAPAYLTSGNGQRLAYRLRQGTGPTLLFLPGYASDMDGAKALALDRLAAARGLSMLRFDYSGTGLSDGDFDQGTLDGWLSEARAMVDRFTDGPLILIGSSMGAWIALHLALQIPGRVQAFVGIAAAPDFTDWGFTREEKAALIARGRLERRGAQDAGPRTTSRRFWESGQALRLLGAPIGIDCPVRLIHGQADEDVPTAVAMRVMAQVRSADVQLNILKGAGHRLSEPHEIDAIVRTVAALLEPAQ